LNETAIRKGKKPIRRRKRGRSRRDMRQGYFRREGNRFCTLRESEKLGKQGLTSVVQKGLLQKLEEKEDASLKKNAGNRQIAFK